MTPDTKIVVTASRASRSNWLFGAVFATGIFLPGQLVACEAWDDRWNNRILLKTDGSFENGNFLDGFPVDFVTYLDNRADSVRGRPVIKVGNGKIAQSISFSAFGCSGTETLLFVDCNTEESILLEGAYPPEGFVQFAGYSWKEIKWLQEPYGPIRITADLSVSELSSVAGRNDIAYTLAADELLGRARARDRYDIYFGCKLFYPDLKPGNSS